MFCLTFYFSDLIHMHLMSLCRGVETSFGADGDSKAPDTENARDGAVGE